MLPYHGESQWQFNIPLIQKSVQVQLNFLTIEVELVMASVHLAATLLTQQHKQLLGLDEGKDKGKSKEVLHHLYKEITISVKVFFRKCFQITASIRGP